MARFGSIPKIFGRIHPRYLTPDVSTLVMGAVVLVWTLVIINVSQNVLSDSDHRDRLRDRLLLRPDRLRLRRLLPQGTLQERENFIMVGVAPFLGRAMLMFIFINLPRLQDTSTDVNYSGGFLGVGTPVAIGVGLLIGVVVMLFANIAYPKFFKRKWRQPTRRPRGNCQGEASVMSD
jgi:amino acid transporter